MMTEAKHYVIAWRNVVTGKEGKSVTRYTHAEATAKCDAFVSTEYEQWPEQVNH